MRVRERAETLLYRIYNLGVTDVISGAHREIVLHGGHAGQDGEAHRRADRVAPTHIDACPSRVSSKRGQKHMRTLAGRVQTETQSHVKVSLSSLVVHVKVICTGIVTHTGRSERRGWAHTASKHASLEGSNTLTVVSRAVCSVTAAEAALVDRSVARRPTRRCGERSDRGR